MATVVAPQLRVCQHRAVLVIADHSAICWGKPRLSAARLLATARRTSASISGRSSIVPAAAAALAE
jgi:hypothetical protein